MAVIWGDVRTVAEMFATGLARAAGWLFSYFKQVLQRLGWLEQHYPAAPGPVIREAHGLMRESVQAARDLSAGRDTSLPELPIGPATGAAVAVVDMWVPAGDYEVSRAGRRIIVELTPGADLAVRAYEEARRRYEQDPVDPDSPPRRGRGPLAPEPGEPEILAAYMYRR